MRPRTPIGTCLVALLMAGCFGGGPGDDETPGTTPPDPVPEINSWPRCEHPYPCGDEWPENVTGPFELRGEVERIEIESHDDTLLRGWLMLPDTPDRVLLPTVLLLSPYSGVFSPAPGATTPLGDWWTDNSQGPYPGLLRAGYAIATVNVRGMGISDGCVDPYGPDERADAPLVVEWLAAQPWSNGRIGMMGYSWPGTTPLAAFVSATPALKAIVSADGAPDFYQVTVTPQGLTFAQWARYGVVVGAEQFSLLPPLTSGDEDRMTYLTEALATRGCGDARLGPHPEPLLHMYGDDRDEAYWAKYRFAEQMAHGTAAVLLTWGYESQLHVFPREVVWASLEGRPRHLYLGPWGHEMPDASEVMDGAAWRQHVVTWFDFWLKGIGDEPFVGRVDWFEPDGRGHVSSAWPPPDVVNETLYITDGRLSVAPGTGAMSFQSVTPLLGMDEMSTPVTGFGEPDSFHSEHVLCSEDLGNYVVAWSEVLEEKALLAGTPLAYLALESDQPAGQIALHLFDVGPNFACQNGVASDVRYLTSGGADLRFHQGNLVAKDFPTASPAPLRIDFHTMAAPIAAGHRLALLAWSGNWYEFGGRSTAPLLSLHADAEMPSHVVLPFFKGTLGGDETAYEYPPRPFMPGAG